MSGQHEELNKRTRKERVCFSCRKDLKESVRSMADRCEMSVSEYINHILDLAVENDVRIQRVFNYPDGSAFDAA